MRTKSFPLIRTAVWAGLLCLYLALSLPELIRRMRIAPPEFSGPYHSTDAYLGRRGASEKVVEIFNALPAGRPVIVFTPVDDAQSAFNSAILSYLGWPREVQGIKIKAEEMEAHLARLDPRTLGGVAFCGTTPPPWLSDTTQLGHRIFLAAFESPPPPAEQ